MCRCASFTINSSYIPSDHCRKLSTLTRNLLDCSSTTASKKSAKHSLEQVVQSQNMNHCTHIQAPAESPNPDETAVVFLGEDLIETSTEKQIKAMMTHRHMRHIRVMPDCHVGHGCCIGFTAHIEAEYVVPSYVGCVCYIMI